MILRHNTIAEYRNDKLVLVKHKGTKSEVRITLECADLHVLHDFVLSERCKAAGIAYLANQPIEPSRVLK